MRRHRTGFFLAILLGAGAAGAFETSLVDLPLEDLGKLEVATLSRKAQKLSDTPAAITVLSADDIRRSGARSIPEALREVPGVNVAQIGSARWAVGGAGRRAALPTSCSSRWMGAASTTRCSQACSGKPRTS